MATRDISYQALFNDLYKKISAKQKEYDNTLDIAKRAKLKSELAQMRQIALDMQYSPDRVFNAVYRLS